MFKLDSEKALLDAFRPKDRKHVEVVPELQFPLFVRHYRAWRHPAGGRVYLVFATPGGAPTGISFSVSDTGGPAVPHMCDWCHCVGKGTEVGMLTAQVNGKRSIGVLVCTDLSCQEKLEEAANLGGKNVLVAMAKLIERMGRFASEGLQIDLSGAGR